MTSLKNSKQVLAEVLVRQVLGESENFERICAQRGIAIEEAVSQALRGWAGHGLTLLQNDEPETDPVVLLLPDPSDCPQGQEEHWLGVIDHDLSTLRKAQQSCFKRKDTAGLDRTNRSIEAYIQAQAELKARVA